MKIHTLTLNGRIPSKKNSKIFARRGQRTFLIPSNKYTQWHKEASLEVKQQQIQMVNNVSEIQLEFVMPDNRKTDLTNKAESVMDLLVDCGIIEDDSWQFIPLLTLSCKGKNKDKPGVTIWIKSE